MKRVRTREPFTVLTKFDRIQVIQVMEDMFNAVSSASEENTDPQSMYDDKTEVRKVMADLLDHVAHMKPKRIRKPRIKKSPSLPFELNIQHQPAAGEYPPFVPKTLEEIQRDGWDFNNFVMSLPSLVSQAEIHKEVLKVNLYSKERTQNFNRQTDISSPDYPNFKPLTYFALEDPSQLLWHQMFGMTPGPFGNCNQPSTSTNLSLLSQVPNNQLQRETEKSSPRKRAPSSKTVKISNVDESGSSTPAVSSTFLTGETQNLQIMTPENIVWE